MRLLWYGTLMPGFGRVAQLCGLSEQALEAVLRGPQSANFEEAFDILVDVSNDAQYFAPTFEDMVSFSVSGSSPELLRSTGTRISACR